MPEEWVALVLEHRAWAIRIARYRARRLPTIDPDDAASEAMLALIAAAKRYDPSRGATFRTFADARIAGAVIDLHRNASPAGRNGWRSPETDPTLVDIDGTVVSVPASQETSAELRAVVEAIDRLPEKLAYAARRHWVDDQGLLTVARELGVSESRVCQLVKEAREMLAWLARA